MLFCLPFEKVWCFKSSLSFVGLAIWREWRIWLCSRAFLFDACSFLSWLWDSQFCSISSICWGLHIFYSTLTQSSLYPRSMACDIFMANEQNHRKTELNSFRICFSLSSYLYFLVTKKSFRLQVHMVGLIWMILMMDLAQDRSVHKSLTNLLSYRSQTCLLITMLPFHFNSRHWVCSDLFSLLWQVLSKELLRKNPYYLIG